jgi:hypothetical protein
MPLMTGRAFLSGDSGKLTTMPFQGGTSMRFTIQLRITDDEGREIADDEIISLDKGDDRLEAIGLSLGEAKDLLSHLQQRLVQAQAASYIAGRRRCEHCGRPFRSKGHYPMSFRTPFGTVEVASPRFHRCGCQPANSKTFSPLTELFTEHGEFQSEVQHRLRIRYPSARETKMRCCDDSIFSSGFRGEGPDRADAIPRVRVPVDRPAIEPVGFDHFP